MYRILHDIPVSVEPTTAEWRNLTILPKKSQEYSSDFYFRECWSDFTDTFSQTAREILPALAVVTTKPDAIVGRRGKAILDFVVGNGFQPIACSPFRLNRHAMREIWRFDWHVYTVDRLQFCTHWYTACDNFMLVLLDTEYDGKVPASVRLSDMKGSALETERRPTDLRSLLGPPNRILNFVHVADEPADVIREVGIMLDHPERLKLWREARGGLDVDRTTEVLHLIKSLEQRYPEHDLHFLQSLERLKEKGVLRQCHAEQLQVVVDGNGLMTWNELSSFLSPDGLSEDSLWDFICVASHVIPYERDVTALLDNKTVCPDAYLQRLYDESSPAL